MPNSVNSDYRFRLHPITRLLRSRVRGCCSLKRSEYTLYSEADFMLGLCRLGRLGRLGKLGRLDEVESFFIFVK